MMLEGIPVVCKHCGKDQGFSQVGEVEVITDVWQRASVEWSPATNALVVVLVGSPMADTDGLDFEDAVNDAVLDAWSCNACTKSARTIDELVEPKYGVDRWNRVLDEHGVPYGPMAVSPEQLTLLAA